MAKFIVDVEVVWHVEVEAGDDYDAEDIAMDMVMGDFHWAIEPDETHSWALEVD